MSAPGGQNFQRAGLEPAVQRTPAIFGAVEAAGPAGRIDDETGEQGRYLLSDKLRVIQRIEIGETHQDRRQPGNPSHLPRRRHLEDVKHVFGRKPRELEARHDRQARPLLPCVIGDAPPGRIELDAGDDPRSGCKLGVIGPGDLLAVEKAQAEPAGPVVNEGDEDFAIDDRPPGDDILQAIKVGEPVEVRFPRPSIESLVDDLARRGVGVRGLGLDAASDKGRSPGVDAGRGIPVVRFEVARAARQRLPGGDLGGQRKVERSLIAEPPAARRAVEAHASGQRPHPLARDAEDLT